MDFLHFGLPLGLAIWIGLIAVRLHREQYEGRRLATAMALLALGTALARLVATPSPTFYDFTAAAFLLLTLSGWVLWIQARANN